MSIIEKQEVLNIKISPKVAEAFWHKEIEFMSSEYYYQGDGCSEIHGSDLRSYNGGEYRNYEEGQRVFAVCNIKEATDLVISKGISVNVIPFTSVSGGNCYYFTLGLKDGKILDSTDDLGVMMSDTEEEAYYAALESAVNYL